MTSPALFASSATGSSSINRSRPYYMWGQYGEVTWGPMLVKTVGRFAPDKNLREKPKDVDWVICKGCMVSREMLLKVGMFDENFWQCNEDVDWSYRIRKNGFRVVYVDRAAILHKGGSSGQSGHKWVFSYGYFIGRNAFTFGWKYGTVPQKIKLFLLLWTGLLGRIAFYALDNTKHAILGQRYFVRGILDGLRGQSEPGLHPGEAGAAARQGRTAGLPGTHQALDGRVGPA